MLKSLIQNSIEQYLWSALYSLRFPNMDQKLFFFKENIVFILWLVEFTDSKPGDIRVNCIFIEKKNNKWTYKVQINVVQGSTVFGYSQSSKTLGISPKTIKINAWFSTVHSSNIHPYWMKHSDNQGTEMGRGKTLETPQPTKMEHDKMSSFHISGFEMHIPKMCK